MISCEEKEYSRERRVSYFLKQISLLIFWEKNTDVPFYLLIQQFFFAGWRALSDLKGSVKSLLGVSLRRAWQNNKLREELVHTHRQPVNASQ